MEILNTKEVAKYIKRSESSVRNLVARGQIPFRQCGGRRLVFIKQELDQWIMEAPGTKLEKISGG